jgi:predicted metal-dependent RNase
MDVYRDAIARGLRHPSGAARSVRLLRPARPARSTGQVMVEYVRVRSQIVNLPMFSVHADASELLEWVGRASPAVVDGEPDASTALAKAITTSLDLTAVVPSFGERVRVGD